MGMGPFLVQKVVLDGDFLYKKTKGLYNKIDYKIGEENEYRSVETAKTK